MRTNKTLRIASVLMIAVLMTTCIIGGTFAKYTTTLNTATAVAQVAKWDITWTPDAETETLVEFNLFDTIKDTKNNNDGEGDPDYTENDVAADRIAPGTQGAFTLTITNNSEVNAEYTIDWTISESVDTPIEFSINGEDWTADIADVVDVTALNMGESINVPVQWRWAFEGEHTSLGETSAETPITVSVSAVIVINQVD